MKYLATVSGVIAALGVTATAVGAPAVPKRASGTLQLQATFRGTYRFGEESTPRWADCPAHVRVRDCVLFTDEAVVPGLGRATASYTKTFSNGCSDLTPVRQFSRAVINVAGKGEIHLAMAEPEPVCGPVAPAQVGPFALTITGGSGTYAGASGSARIESSVGSADCRLVCRGSAFDTLTATLTVPGLDFDVTPPVVTGAASKTVRARKGQRRVRVRYTVTAEDAVDGGVRVACSRRSGSFFKRGRTRVTCSATDSSGNTSRARFTINVR